MAEATKAKYFSPPADAAAASSSDSPSVPGRIEVNGDVALLTYDDLHEAEALKAVRDAGAGASVLFVGTTRDSFEDKQVTRLEYEAYTSLALKTLRSILIRAHSTTWPPPPLAASESTAAIASSPQLSITRIYIAHRLGVVPVAEPSILVCVSSPHRKQAFKAAEWALDEVKSSVQIWKREVYGTAEQGGLWKAN